MSSTPDFTYERKPKSNFSLYGGIILALMLFGTCGGLIRNHYQNPPQRPSSPHIEFTTASLEAIPALRTVQMSPEVQQKIGKPITVVGAPSSLKDTLIYLEVRGPQGTAEVTVIKSGSYQSRDYKIEAIELWFEDGSTLELQDFVTLDYTNM